MENATGAGATTSSRLSRAPVAPAQSRGGSPTPCDTLVVSAAGQYGTRHLLAAEIVIVLALSLGRSAIYAIVDLISVATARDPLRSHQAVLNPSLPGRPWLDLTLQLLAPLFGLAPVALAIYLLVVSGTPLGGWPGGRRDACLDLARGAALAALVGSFGLALYRAARSFGINLTVVAEDLPQVWGACRCWSSPPCRTPSLRRSSSSAIWYHG